MTTIGLVVLILLLVYRAPLLALIPLLTIGVSLVVATDLLALLTQVNRLEGFSWWQFKVFSTTKIFIVVILFGAGTDFCLFLISRFREELERGRSSAQALADAVGWVGHALVGSAMTTIFGLGMMYFADFGKYRNSGPAIAISLVVALLACLTLAPALVRAGGDKVFWPGGVRVRSAGSARQGADLALSLTARPSIWNGFWDWASRVIISYPGWILIASVLVLLPPAYEGLSVPVTYDLLNELQADRPSVVGTRMALRHFSAGEMTPITILAVEEDGHFDEREGEKHIAELTKTLYEVEGVASVRSITEPLGDPPGFFQPFRAEGLKKLAARKHKLTKATYLTQVPELVGKVARFDVVLKYEPFSPQAVKVLNSIDRLLMKFSSDRESSWHDARFEFDRAHGRRSRLGTSHRERSAADPAPDGAGRVGRVDRHPAPAGRLSVSDRVGAVQLLRHHRHHRVGFQPYLCRLVPGTGLEGADLLVRDPDRGRRGLQHLPGHPSERGTAAPRPAGGAPVGHRLDRRDHHQLRCDHGRDVRVDAQRDVAGDAGARFRPLAGGDARYLHRPPDLGARLPGRARPSHGTALGRQGWAVGVAPHGPAMDGRASVVCSAAAEADPVVFAARGHAGWPASARRASPTAGRAATLIEPFRPRPAVCL